MFNIEPLKAKGWIGVETQHFISYKINFLWLGKASIKKPISCWHVRKVLSLTPSLRKAVKKNIFLMDIKKRTFYFCTSLIHTYILKMAQNSEYIFRNLDSEDRFQFLVCNLLKNKDKLYFLSFQLEDFDTGDFMKKVPSATCVH